MRIEGVPTGKGNSFYGANKQVMESREQQLFVVGPAECGKAQPYSALVCTPDGFKPMCSITQGDAVIASDGKPVTVLDTYPQGVQPVYKLTFSDGTSAESTEEHLWQIYYLSKDKKNNCTITRSKTVPLSEILHSYRRGGTGRRKYNIPLTMPVEFSERAVLLDPYLLGVLLGDGCMSQKSTLTVSLPDKEILSEVQKRLPVNSKIKFYNKCGYGISAITGRKNPVIEALRFYKLQGHKSLTKFIPDDYLYNSIEVRTELLRGLLDTDATVSEREGRVEFNTGSIELSKGVKFLVESLGGIVSIRPRISQSGNTDYRVCVRFKNNGHYFRLSRKKNRCKIFNRRTPKRFIEKIEYVRHEECKCILIDHPSNLYLTNNFIVTHNSYACVYKCVLLAFLYPGIQIAFVRKNYASLNTSVIPGTLKPILQSAGLNTTTSFYGNNRPEWYDFPKAKSTRHGIVYEGESRIWFGGMDNPTKVLSSARDIIYCNQPEELTLKDWEYLVTRATGRAANAPYSQVIGDCNPDVSKHWIKEGAEQGRWPLYNAVHQDNPTLYDHKKKEWTERGKRTLKILSGLTGDRYKRLFLGQWVGREGMIYSDVWTPETHIVQNPEPVDYEWPRFWVVDFGFSPDPMCISFFALRPDGVYVRYKLVYITNMTVENHAKRLADWIQTGVEPRPFQIIADHDADGRATLEFHLGIKVTPAKKRIWDGIEATKAFLNPKQPGGSRILFYPNWYALVEEDPILKQNHQPLGFTEEVEGYVVNPKTAMPDSRCPDHEADCVRYLCFTRQTVYEDPLLLMV